MKDKMEVVLEFFDDQEKYEGNRIIIQDEGPFRLGRVSSTPIGVELQFGGLTVLQPSGRNMFELMSRSQSEPAIVDEADVPDTIRFMASRFKDFSGTIVRQREP